MIPLMVLAQVPSQTKEKKNKSKHNDLSLMLIIIVMTNHVADSSILH